MHRCRIPLHFIVGLGLTGPALAQAPDGVLQGFQRLDANGDGWINLAELDVFPRMKSRLAGADADRDGLLSLEEFRRGRLATAQAAPTAQPESGRLSPGDHTRTVKVGDVVRRYRAHVPASYDPDRPMPVVIAFHGGGGNPESMVRLSGLNAKAEAAGFVVLYPYGSGPDPERGLSFNGGECCGHAMVEQVDDVGFTRAMLDDWASVANLDADRVFATGLSNGGIMAHHVASELADRIAAIAPIGGPLMMPAPRASRPVPVMHFHGTADAFAPFNGGYGRGAAGGRGVTDFRSVEHTIQAWVKHNGCQPEPRTETLPDRADDGMTVTRRVWSGGEQGSEVVLIEIVGGGHTWPGMQPLVTALGASTRDVSANDLMWEFFQRHPRRLRTAVPSRPQQDGAKAVSEAESPGDAAARPVWVLPEVQAPRLQRVVWDSQVVGQPVSCYVFTPAAYEVEPERRFPVLYWLHGSGGSTPAAAAQLARRYDTAMQAGRIPPMLMVFPNGLPMGMWCDWKDGSVKLETLFFEELIPHLDRRFRTQARREGRLLEGFSMGGYGAARLGFKRPQMFAAVSLFGAGPLQLDFTEAPRAGPKGRDRVLGTVYGGDMAYYQAQSPWRLAEQNAEQLRTGMAIRQVIGDRDETLRFNRDFKQHLDALQIPHSYRQLPGIPHDPNLVLDALGEAHWAFYRQVLGEVPGTEP